MAQLTRSQRVRRAGFTFTVAVLLAASAYCGWRERQERRWLAQVAQRVVADAGARTTREKSVALRDFVRIRVNTKGAPFFHRPFLRATAQETLESGLGYCGECSRAFVRLAHEVGLRAQRVNLHGRWQHVVAEVELDADHFVLFDPQNNSMMNVYFDGSDLNAEQLILQLNSPFHSYSNLNFRRLPLLGSFIRHIRIEEGWFSRTMESPWLIKADLGLLLVTVLISAAAADRLLIRHYAQRLGTGFSTTRPPQQLPSWEFRRLPQSRAG